MKRYDGGAEIKRSWSIAVIGFVIAVGAILIFSMGGCSNQTVRDLEGVPVTDPDKVRLVVSTDQFPNVVAICVEGQGFVTTTRDAAGAIMLVPGWGEEGGWCRE